MKITKNLIGKTFNWTNDYLLKEFLKNQSGEIISIEPLKVKILSGPKKGEILHDCSLRYKIFTNRNNTNTE